MTKKLPTLGELELRVLQAVWAEQPCTERQVWERLCGEGKIGRTTVLKTLQRLEGKQLLTRRESAGRVQFRAAVEQRRMLPAMIRKFVERTLCGSMEPLVAYLADHDKLSQKDVAALKAIAKKMTDDGKKPK